MEPKTMTREEIIELINDYIYTNGLQRITAAQLNEVLVEMAKSFAIEGGASSGIDAVLATGSIVTEGRTISNEEGGAFKLSAEMEMGQVTYQYVGMDFKDELSEGIAYVGKSMSVIGSRLIPVEENEDPTPAATGEAEPGPKDSGVTEALTIYNLAFSEPTSTEEAPEAQPSTNRGDRRLPVGIVSLVKSNEYNSTHFITPQGVGMDISPNGEFATGSGRFNLSGNMASLNLSTEDKKSASINLQTNQLSTSVSSDIGSTSTNQSNLEISSVIYSGPQTSGHVQTALEFNWNVQNSGIISVNNNGLTLGESKKLSLTPGGAVPTSGRATLAGGSVSVATTAVKSNSVISLTVQETGTFVGNIRVSSKTPNSGFVISSTQDTDTCEVFWQIIDL